MWSRTHAPIPLVDPEKLKFCIDNHLNVLLQGKHGVGKTTLVKQAFERAGLNLLVFSGPTMDPWVDFVGVPRPVTRTDGTSVLELVRRAEFADDAVDAVFIDEFNRAPAKVRNAALELLQFQSVNDHRFERLKSVWAAINPATDEYDTEKLDAAQLDRFHVRIDVPYRPCPEFFVQEFGSVGRAALEWWDAQGDEAKQKVSPRRLEYAVRAALIGGPVRDILPSESNIRRFLHLIAEGPIFDELKRLLSKNDRTAAQKLMQDPDSGTQALAHILASKAAAVFFLPLLEPERLMALLENPKVLDVAVRYSESVPEFRNVVSQVLKGDRGSPLAKRAEALVKTHKVSLGTSDQPVLVTPDGEMTNQEKAELDPYGRFEN